jgi:hypothetical protein
MVEQHQGTPKSEGSQDPATPQGVNPRDTEHPAGSQQAAENAETDSPS